MTLMTLTPLFLFLVPQRFYVFPAMVRFDQAKCKTEAVRSGI
jgi:hypothetical protein